jgi:hypothetical protein
VCSSDLEDKVVYCCAEQELSLRPGVVGFPLLSRTEDGCGYRWQEQTDTGVRRHYDEWTGTDGTRTKIDFYCPYRIRVPDGDLLSDVEENGPWKETYLEAEMTVDPEGTATWDECLAAKLDPETCTVDSLPDGCLLSEPAESWHEWTVVALDEKVTVETGTFTTLHISNVDDQGETASFWWARGRGKVKEESSPVETEELVDYCLPEGSTESPPPIYPDLADDCPE